MMTAAMFVALAMMATTLVLNLWRLVRGPSAVDRVVVGFGSDRRLGRDSVRCRDRGAAAEAPELAPRRGTSVASVAPVGARHRRAAIRIPGASIMIKRVCAAAPIGLFASAVLGQTLGAPGTAPPPAPT